MCKRREFGADLLEPQVPGSNVTLGSLYGENVTSKKFRCFLSFLSQKHCVYLSVYTQTTRASHQTLTEVQMCDHAGTKHALEQPRRHGWRPRTGNLLRDLGTQQLHDTRPEPAVTSGVQHERTDASKFDVWTPWGCGVLGCPRPWRAAQTAPHAVSAVSAGCIARLRQVRRVRSPSRRYRRW